MINWKKIRKLSQFNSEEDIREFENIIWEIGSSKNLQAVGKLIDLFNDDCPYHSVMYSIIHAIEQIPSPVYVLLVMRKIEKGLKKYPLWTDCIFNRIFNDEECVKIFQENMHIVNNKDLLNLFDLMEKESPHHKDLLNTFRKQII